MNWILTVQAVVSVGFDIIKQSLTTVNVPCYSGHMVNDLMVPLLSHKEEDKPWCGMSPVLTLTQGFCIRSCCGQCKEGEVEPSWFHSCFYPAGSWHARGIGSQSSIILEGSGTSYHVIHLWSLVTSVSFTTGGSGIQQGNVASIVWTS